VDPNKTYWPIAVTALNANANLVQNASYY